MLPLLCCLCTESVARSVLCNQYVSRTKSQAVSRECLHAPWRTPEHHNLALFLGCSARRAAPSAPARRCRAGSWPAGCTGAGGLPPAASPGAPPGAGAALLAAPPAFAQAAAAWPRGAVQSGRRAGPQARSGMPFTMQPPRPLLLGWPGMLQAAREWAAAGGPPPPALCTGTGPHHGRLGRAAVGAQALVAQAQRLGARLCLAVRGPLQVLLQQRLAAEAGLRRQRQSVSR